MIADPSIDYSARAAYLVALESCWLDIEDCSPLALLSSDVWPLYRPADWIPGGKLAGFSGPRCLEELAGAGDPFIPARQALEVWASRFCLLDEWAIDAAVNVLHHFTVTGNPSATWPYEIPPCRPFLLDLAELQTSWTPPAEEPLRSLAGFVREQITVIRKQHGEWRRNYHQQAGDLRFNAVLAERFVFRQAGYSLGSIAAYWEISAPTVLEGIKTFALRTGSRIPASSAIRRRLPLRIADRPLPKAA